MTREQIVLRFAYLERVLATRIPFPQPLLTDWVWNIEQVKLVGRTRLFDQRSHPFAIPNSVCREIQNNRKALP
jgi:hypothetical protein